MYIPIIHLILYQYKLPVWISLLKYLLANKLSIFAN